MATHSPHSGTVALRSALDNSEPLARLLQRLRESQARLAAVSPLLPPELRATIRPGSLDEKGWQLLVSHSAGAAKLRQWLPQLQATLLAQGWADVPIRVKVLPRS